MVHCSSSSQLLLTLHFLETSLSTRPSLALLLVDSISAFYWLDRSEGGASIAKQEEKLSKCSNLLARLLRYRWSGGSWGPLAGSWHVCLVLSKAERSASAAPPQRRLLAASGLPDLGCAQREQTGERQTFQGRFPSVPSSLLSFPGTTESRRLLRATPSGGTPPDLPLPPTLPGPIFVAHGNG